MGKLASPEDLMTQKNQNAKAILQNLAAELICDNPDTKKIKYLCVELNIPYSDDSITLMSHVLELINNYPNNKSTNVEAL